MAEQVKKETLQEKLQRILKRKRGISSVMVLDLDEKRLGILLASKHSGGRMRITRYEEVELGMESSIHEKDDAQLGMVIAKKLKELKIREKNVVFGVPRSEVMLRQLMIPYVEKEGEVASMIHFQIARDLPFRVEDAVIDFFVDAVSEMPQLPLESEEEKAKESEDRKPKRQMEVTVAVVPNMVVARYQKVAQAAGLNFIALGFESFARIECLRYCGLVPKDDKKAVLMLSMTANTAVIDIQQGGHLIFSREASLSQESGKKSATEEIEEQAEHIEQITTETVRCLHAYEQDELHGQISKIYITNFGDKTALLMDALRARTMLAGIEVSEFSPSVLLRLGDAEKWNGLVVASTCGLAASVIEQGRLDIDFLNPRKPASPDSGKTKQAVMVAVIVLLFFCMFFMIRSHVLKKGTEECAVLQQQVNELSKKQGLWRQYVVQALSVRSWERGERHWLDHLAKLSSLLPDAENLYVSGFSTGTRSNIVLSLRASQSDVITKLDAQLREAGYRLKSPAMTPISSRSGYGFQTTMELIYSGKEKPNLEELGAVSIRPKDDISLSPVKGQRELMQQAAQKAKEESQKAAATDNVQKRPPEQGKAGNPAAKGQQQQRRNSNANNPNRPRQQKKGVNR